MKYAFLLGRNPDISIAELGAFFGDKLTFPNNKSAAFVEAPLPAAPQVFLDRLGGCVEIVEIFAEGLQFTGAEKAIFDFLKKTWIGKPGKCNFAVSLVPENAKSNAIRFLLPRLKKSLRAEGISNNFMNNNFKNVSPVLAHKQGLVKDRTNISIIEAGEGMIAIGCSVAIQDIDAYSKRDYGKPFRDARVGMLPPKLAQVMVNLCHFERSPATAGRSREISSRSLGFARDDNFVIVDPFCGTGTILAEAMLMGHSAVGSDADARMIEGAEKNLAWLRTPHHAGTGQASFKIPENLTSKVFAKSATDLTKTDFPTPPFAIATEPNLGPPLSSFPAEKYLEKVEIELSDLYLKFFQNLAKLIPAGTPVVFIFPFWKKAQLTTINISARLIDKIEALGYSKTTFAPLQTTSLFYERPDQIVGREIVRFVKK